MEHAPITYDELNNLLDNELDDVAAMHESNNTDYSVKITGEDFLVEAMDIMGAAIGNNESEERMDSPAPQSLHYHVCERIRAYHRCLEQEMEQD